jgi:arylsulfatase A-like enzyme
MRVGAFLLLLTCAGPLAGAPAAEPPRPNILLIVSDDQGYADAGFQGCTDIPTPHLDALAKSGVRCTSGYVTHSFCSPSRAGLLTGRQQQRFGHEFNPVYDPLDPAEGLPLGERLLPQPLKEAGWKTGWVGKWHLGASPGHAPWRRGFDETFGFIGGGHRYLNWQPNERQYTLALTRDGKPVEVTGHLTTALGEEASAFVRRHRDEPWFLYLAFNAPHTPHEPTPERLEKLAVIEDPVRRKYAAQLGLMDDAVGAVTAALAETRQDRRTLVFFFSDNGGPFKTNGSRNTPLRGQKGDLYEGGVRVPFLVCWPDRLPAGARYDLPVSSLDVFATALAAAGAPRPIDRACDGVNLVPYLAGGNTSPPHERLFWRMGGGKAHAVREGTWKLVRAQNKPAELFDLAADVGETRDLASEKPEVAARLGAALDAWDRELMAPVFPGSSVKNEDWGPGGANQKDAAGGGKPGRKRSNEGGK